MFCAHFFKDFIYFLERERGRERNINACLPLEHPLLETWPAAWTCALDWESNWRSFDLQAGTQPLSHTSQGSVLNCDPYCQSQETGTGLVNIWT